MDDVSAWNRIVYFVNARGINFSFFSCHLLWRASYQVQYSSPWMSYQDLFFWQKSRCNQNRSESPSISGVCMGMNNIESCLAKFQHFFYHFSFMTFILLRKLYACSFNAKKYKAAHILSCCLLICVWIHTHKHKIREKYCDVPTVLNVTPRSFTNKTNSSRRDPVISCWRMRS